MLAVYYIFLLYRVRVDYHIFLFFYVANTIRHVTMKGGPGLRKVSGTRLGYLIFFYSPLEYYITDFIYKWLLLSSMKNIHRSTIWDNNINIYTF